MDFVVLVGFDSVGGEEGGLHRREKGGEGAVSSREGEMVWSAGRAKEGRMGRTTLTWLKREERGESSGQLEEVGWARDGREGRGEEEEGREGGR